MNFSIQPTLKSLKVNLLPLKQEDFEELYELASDPEVWAQHPNKNRWKREVFEVFFEGAMQSHGAFKIVDKATGKALGCTRFYDYKKEDDSILIGYTFYGKASWGKGINLHVKALMLNYIFQFVSTVFFHIGAVNVRSQIAILRLGATKVAEEEITYYGEDPKLNYVYRLTRNEWQNSQP